MKLARMGNCMRKHKDSDREVVLSIFGLDDSGKTTTTKVLKGDKDLADVVPTIGFEPQKFSYRSFNLSINDLGGGERVRDLWKHYMAESFGFIYVIDSSNRKRIEETKKEFTQFVKNSKVSGKPVLLLGNKQDKANALDESEIVQLLDIEEIVNSTKTPCRVETCTVIKIDKHVDPSLKAGFDWLIKHVEVNYEDLRARIDKESSEQRNRESREMAEKRRKIEERRKLEKRDDDDDATDYTQIKRDPFRPIGDRFKDDNKSSFTSSYDDNKLSSYDKQSELRTSPRPRLTTIDEERAKLKNKSAKGNKLMPIDDGSDLDLYNRNSKNSPSSWAITDNSGPGLKKRSMLAPS